MMGVEIDSLAMVYTIRQIRALPDMTPRQVQIAGQAMLSQYGHGWCAEEIIALAVSELRPPR